MKERLKEWFGFGVIYVVVFTVCLVIAGWYQDARETSKVIQQVSIDGDNCGCSKYRNAGNSGSATNNVHVK